MLKSKKFTLLVKKHVEIEIVYTSGQNKVEIEIVYTSAQIHDFRTIKGKQCFAIHFPNVDFLMIKGKQTFAIYFPNVDLFVIKGKQLFVIFQVLASILGFYVLGCITLSLS